MRKFISVIIGIVLLVSTLVFSTACFDGCGPSVGSNREPFVIVDSETIKFGSYPQTKVTDSELEDALLNKAGDPRSSTSGWASYNYYTKAEKSDCMYYKDVEINGEEYRGVYIKNYRPYWAKDASSTSNSYQDDNGYYNNSVYWFKYEWIEWTIVEDYGSTKTLVSKLIIDSQEFDYEPSISKSNYEESTIRAWLNSTFYQTAFDDVQQSLIKTVEVDNSLSTTGDSQNPYVSDNTFDKVYLLSYEEATDYFYNKEYRQKSATEYAKCQGEFVSTSGNTVRIGNGRWWLRTPGNNFNNFVKYVLVGGGIDLSGVYVNNVGVVPALQIQI